MKWEMNSLYVSDESIFTHTTVASSSNKTKTRDGIGSKHNVEILPMWLQAKESMIYSQHSVQKGEQIGQGQFGAVFKGKIILGSSVYGDAIYIYIYI